MGGGGPHGGEKEGAATAAEGAAAAVGVHGTRSQRRPCLPASDVHQVQQCDACQVRA